MKRISFRTCRRWLGTYVLAMLIMPWLHSQGDLLRITQDRMMALARIIEQYHELTGSYPEVLNLEMMKESAAEPDPTMLHDAWGRRWVYCGRKGSSKEDPGEYWLGSACGKGEFGGFLRHMTRQETEGDDLVMRNGRFLGLCGDDHGFEETRS